MGDNNKMNKEELTKELHCEMKEEEKGEVL